MTEPAGPEDGASVVLFADTFNSYFEPETLRMAAVFLARLGYRVHMAAPEPGERPLCCGRTFLTAGLVYEARIEANRLLKTLEPFAHEGVPIIGLEPSCLFALARRGLVASAARRDEKGRREHHAARDIFGA